MSNSPSNRRFHVIFQRNTTRATDAARSGVGAGYRSGLPPSQTQKSGKNRFFSARCGWAFRPLRAGPAMPGDSLYMGPFADINPVWLILPRKTRAAAQKARFSRKSGWPASRGGRTPHTRLTAIHRRQGRGRARQDRFSGYPGADPVTHPARHSSGRASRRCVVKRAS